MQVHAELLGLDANQVQVKQRMDVSSKEQAVFRMFVLFTTIRLFLGGLQDRQNLAASYQASVGIPLSQGIAERLLTPPFLNLSLDYLSAVAFLEAKASFFVGQADPVVTCLRCD